MKKLSYETPEFIIARFDAESVVTASAVTEQKPTNAGGGIVLPDDEW